MAMNGYSGVYVGLVSGSRDATNSGRVQVQLPSLGITSQWAAVCYPFGLPRMAPSVGSKVAVAFEGGDPDRPIVLGALT